MTEQTNDTTTNENYKGFSLFNDIEDIDLRIRNRAVVMSNIAEANTNKDRNIRPAGVGLILGYFNSVPKEEKKATIEKFVSTMKERGFQLVIKHEAPQG